MRVLLECHHFLSPTLSASELVCLGLSHRRLAPELNPSSSRDQGDSEVGGYIEWGCSYGSYYWSFVIRFGAAVANPEVW